MQWYYANEGRRTGPVGVDEFERLVRADVISAKTLVWRQGMPAWVAYGTIGSTADAGAVRADDGTEVCAMSLKRYPRREMIQYEGRWISAEHRDAFFQRLREGVPLPSTMVYGTFLERVGAKILDAILGWVIGTVANMIVALAVFGTPNFFGASPAAHGQAKMLTFQLISTPLGVLLGLLYSWFFLSRYDATPGKMAVGLKVVRSDGSKLSTGRIIGRHFAEWLSGLLLAVGYLMAAFDDERRTLHDRICDTRVIKAK